MVKNLNCLMIVLLFAAIFVSTACASCEKSSDDILVGVYYFCGWSKGAPQFTQGGGDWMPEYPGREPLLGKYSEQATMDAEIDAASAFGVDFFQILWYPEEGKKPAQAFSDSLDKAVNMFMNSERNSSMKFTLEFVNHDPFKIDTDEGWEEACRYWAGVMKHPSYLRVGGRPVFKIHGLWHFLKQNGGDYEKVRERVKTLKRIAMEEGLPEPLVSAGILPGDTKKATECGAFDFYTSYMDVPKVEKREEPYPYSVVLDLAKGFWRQIDAELDVPYAPYLPAGWDPRPWGDPRASFNFPTKDEWVGALRDVKAVLESGDNWNLPAADGKPVKMFIIYAWNEYGEGGIVAPTKGEGYMKLRGIREVFGK